MNIVSGNSQQVMKFGSKKVWQISQKVIVGICLVNAVMDLGALGGL